MRPFSVFRFPHLTDVRFKETERCGMLPSPTPTICVFNLGWPYQMEACEVSVEMETVDGEPIGWASYFYGKMLGYIYDIHIYERLRRMGFGRKLLTHVLDDMKTMGIREVYMSPVSPSGKALAISLGFRPVGWWTTLYVRKE